ncbi:RcnB family protein [Rhizobiaceae bacterium BDR2-2]|uniref:RcnB family protein n=1 Tax=Ectorhizobium quercum TaxID=2965071 RepID=A0AAE3SWW3_9HYPH|nr:RcnB family protein [Ectorhizobium quercum]MCX8999845.1 RcnB family protein [Ectorhizobium quercum]
MQHSRPTAGLFSAILLVAMSVSPGAGSLVGAAHAAGQTPVKKIEQPAKQQQKAATQKAAAWKKGGKYSGKGAAVTDYRRYNLKTPPKGHRWVREGNQYLLVATATGVIAAIAGN